MALRAGRPPSLHGRRRRTEWAQRVPSYLPTFAASQQSTALATRLVGVVGYITIYRCIILLDCQMAHTGSSRPAPPPPPPFDTYIYIYISFVFRPMIPFCTYASMLSRCSNLWSTIATVSPPEDNLKKCNLALESGIQNKEVGKASWGDGRRGRHHGETGAGRGKARECWALHPEEVEPQQPMTVECGVDRESNPGSHVRRQPNARTPVNPTMGQGDGAAF